MRSNISIHNNNERSLMIRTENWWLYWKDNEWKNGSSILTLLKYRISMVDCHFRRNEAKWISMSRFAKKWLGFEAWIKAIISTVKYTQAVKLQAHTHTHAHTHTGCPASRLWRRDKKRRRKTNKQEEDRKWKKKRSYGAIL